MDNAQLRRQMSFLLCVAQLLPRHHTAYSHTRTHTSHEWLLTIFLQGWILVNLALWKAERKLFRSIKTTEQLKRFVNDEKARLEFVRKVRIPLLSFECFC